MENRTDKNRGGLLLSVANLRTVCEELAEVVGRERLQDVLATYEPQRIKGIPASLLHESQAHPLAVEWRELMDAVTASEREGQFLLPDRSYFLLDHLIRLRSISDVDNISELLDRLTKKDEYYSALFEIFILSFYRNAGNDIEIVPRTPHKRTPDFIVRAKNRDVYIECKSLEDRSRKEQRVWGQIEGRILRSLTKARRSWRVTIQAKRTLHGADIQIILGLAAERIKADSLAAQQTPDNGVTLTFESFANPSVWQFGGVQIERRTERFVAEADHRIGRNGNLLHRNIRMVESAPFYSSNETKRILSDVSDAHGQIPEGQRGIVHIEIPFRNSGRILAVADDAFQRVFGLLKQRQRLNAVVLSSRIKNPSPREGQDAVWDYFVVVPNARPQRPLPKSFRIAGWSGAYYKQPVWDWVRQLFKFMWWNLKSQKLSWRTILNMRRELSRKGGGKGFVAIKFDIGEPLSEQTGRSLYNYCSSDGTRQLRLWQSFENHFRVDIVDVSFGRRTFRSDANELSVGTVHDLAVGWSAESLWVAVDGRPLEPVEHAHANGM